MYVTAGGFRAGTAMKDIDERWLGIFVCPETHAPLVQAGAWLYSTDGTTRRKYPIRDGIPVLVVEESRVAHQDEYRRAVEHGNVEQPAG